MSTRAATAGGVHLFRLSLSCKPSRLFFFASLAFLFPPPLLKYGDNMRKNLNRVKDFNTFKHLFLLLSRFLYGDFLNSAAPIPYGKPK
jgi:hypothetical protein